jgi:hypothetical protein
MAREVLLKVDGFRPLAQIGSGRTVSELLA